ncbi:MAG: SDR family oxidoreductase, partial [Bellilinea sp.]
MKNIYQKKHVLITGGSSGIGLAVAKGAARLGANISIISRRLDVLEQAQLEILEQRSEETFVNIISADVSNEEEIAEALHTLVFDRELPDIVINCAGVTHPGEFYKLSTDIFRWNMEINYYGTVYVLKALVPGMIRRGSGRIVNISSGVGIMNIYGYTAYGASKFAVNGLTEALRMELKPHGIQVSLVIPADTNTPQLAYEDRYKPAVTRELNKVGGLMEPEAVAEELLAGVSRGRYLILPGSDIKFLYALLRIFGRSLFYRYLDAIVSKTLKTVPPGEDDFG